MEEIIDTEEICNFPISPLIVAPNAVQWSSDNHISIMTKKGVLVLQLKHSPMSPQPQLKFLQSFIYPSDTLPTQPFIEQIELSWKKLKHKDILSLLWDTSLIPKIGETMDINVRIDAVAWSPQKLLHPDKCILAIITSVGAIELLHQFSSSINWYSLCNLTSCWLDITQEEISNNLAQHENVDSLYLVIKQNIERVLCRTMVWSSLYTIDQECFAYLATVSNSSELILWKIPQIVNPKETIVPKVAHMLSLNTKVKVNVLHWIDITHSEYLIIIGYFDGQVHGARYRTTVQSLEHISMSKYYTRLDKLPVNSFYVLSRNKRGLKILVNKDQILLLLSLNSTYTVEDIRHLCIAQNISGISVIDDHNILVTVQDGTIFMINVGENYSTNIKVKSFTSKSHIQYLGLCSSPLRSVFVSVTSPCSMYDHLIIREPSTIHIFSLKTEEQNPLHLTSKYKDISSEHFWEYLEILKVKAIKADNPAMYLPEIPADLESVPLQDLRLYMWISVIKEVCTNRKEIPDIINFASKVSDAQSLIFLHSAAAYLIHLSKRTNLTEDQELSISLLRMYFEIYLAGEDDEQETLAFRTAKRAIEATSHITQKLEKCAFCNITIDEMPWISTKCLNGHILSRCTLTFMQITSIQFKFCPICKQAFHPFLDELYEDVRCLYCDVPAIYDWRVLDVKESSVYTKNLSKQIIDNKDSEKNDFEKNNLEKNLDSIS